MVHIPKACVSDSSVSSRGKKDKLGSCWGILLELLQVRPVCCYVLVYMLLWRHMQPSWPGGQQGQELQAGFVLGQPSLLELLQGSDGLSPGGSLQQQVYKLAAQAHLQLCSKHIKPARSSSCVAG